MDQRLSPRTTVTVPLDCSDEGVCGAGPSGPSDGGSGAVVEGAAPVDAGVTGETPGPNAGSGAVTTGPGVGSGSGSSARAGRPETAKAGSGARTGASRLVEVVNT